MCVTHMILYAIYKFTQEFGMYFFAINLNSMSTIKYQGVTGNKEGSLPAAVETEKFTSACESNIHDGLWG